MNEFKFKQILEICKSENMYEDIKKDDTERLRFLKYPLILRSRSRLFRYLLRL